MKPLKPRKSIEGINRAKMYIRRDLDVFVGYPKFHGGWISQPEGIEPDMSPITREHIHNATFTINKLVRDFPKALPKIVGDVDKWSTRYKNLLEILKTSIHNGNPYPESLADINPEFGEKEKKLLKKLIRDNPSLSYVINSFSWITYLNPETFKEAVSWLYNNIANIDKIYKSFEPSEGTVLIIKLWRLSKEMGEKRVNLILVWMSDARIYEIPMDKGYNYAFQVNDSLGRKKNDSIPENPKAKFGKEIVKWVDWLSMQDNKTAKRSVELFDLVYDISFVDNWDYWWKQLNTCIKNAEKITRPLTRNNPLNAKLNTVREKIKSIGKNAPPAIKAKLLFSLLVKWSEINVIKDYEKIVKALGALPVVYDNIPLRMAFLSYWNTLFEENGASKHKTILKIIEEFSLYIKGHNDFKKAIMLWERVLDCWKSGENPERYIFTIDDDILDEITVKEEITLVFNLIKELYKDRKLDELTHDEARNFILLFKSLAKEDVLDTFSELRKNNMSDEYIARYILELALKITGSSHMDLGIVLKTLHDNRDRYNDISEVIKPVLSALDNSIYKTFLLDAVKGGQLRILCETSLNAGIIEYFSGKDVGLPSIIEEDTEWILLYPKGLHKELINLAQSDIKAEATAKRILSKDFPDIESLKKEIDELIIKIEKGEDQEGFLKKRTEKLQKIIEQNRPGYVENDKANHVNNRVVSEQRLKNLAKKLRHAAMMGVLNRWKDEVETKFKDCIMEYLNVNEFPLWFERNNVPEVILSAAELEEPFKNILKRILVRRASSLPWDFRDEPDNKTFIEKLKDANINMAPWLDGDDKDEIGIFNGEKLIVTIERDPIEIFSMGLHFNTCLSPGGINFFSVFSNIIDINKQVVYGKTPDGSVKARALIALTDEGGILTFHPYCNYSSIDFDNILKGFVHELARNMKTVVLPKGSVSKLVAPDWYDDGPRDLTEKFPFVLEGSDFKKKIMDMDTPELLFSMKEAVEPIGLNELTIPLFIFLPEISECKKLIDALYPYVQNLTNLSFEAIFKYTEVLLEAERTQMLEGLAPKIVDYVLNINRDYCYWEIINWVELLIKISPSQALAVLRKTRHKDVRTWEEDEGERVAAAGMAYLKLNRPKKAAKLFSICLGKNVSKEVKDYCIKQLEELGE